MNQHAIELTYYNHQKRKAYLGVPRTDSARHSMGGAAAPLMAGSSLPLPFDLLFTLDLDDPAIDLELSPNVRWLPLVYGFAYMGYYGEQRYGVYADGTFEVADELSLQPDEDGSPQVSSETGIELVDMGLDLSKAEDALSMLQVFGLGDLSESELERAIEIAYSPGYPLDVNEDWIVYKDLTKQKYLEFWGSSPFWQPGGISTSCSNPECGGQDAQVFATCGSSSALVIFRHCPDCQSILTHNQA